MNDLEQKVTYRRAIDTMIFLMNEKIIKDAFQASTILAALFMKEKEQTLDDITTARGYPLGSEK